MQLEAGGIHRVIAHFPMTWATPQAKSDRPRVGHARDCNAREAIARRRPP